MPRQSAPPHASADIARDSHKRAEIEIRTPGFMARDASKPFGWSHGWGAEVWIDWATVTEMLHRLEIPSGASVLDVGCGTGWTTAFLAEAGYAATGVDLVPANVEAGRERAARWGLDAGFVVADMEELELGRTFDAVLVLDALHHSTRQAQAIERVARHLRLGGWALLGEPSILHRFSPHARETTRALGWTERGVSARALRRDCRRAGLGTFQRFHQGTRPYRTSAAGCLSQLARLVGSQVAVAPQMRVWLAARRER